MALSFRLRCGASGCRIKKCHTRLPSALMLAALGILGLCALARGDGASLGPSAVSSDAEQDAKGPLLGVSRVEVRYVSGAAVRSELLPPTDELRDATIELGSITRGGGTVYVNAIGRADMPEGAITRTTLSGLAELPGHRFAASAVRSISEQITAYITSRGFAGVYVEPDAGDVKMAEAAAEGAAHAPRVVLHFHVHVAVVRQIRTIEVGDHAPPTDAQGNGKINNQADERIVEHSPLELGGQDLLRKGEVDDYVQWLNRQPGRRVDAAVNSAEGPDSVSLDYLVTRDKPWQIYSQVSNTGTRQTNQWLERFGFIDNQLTGHDDTLSIDYSTAAFDNENSINVSYDKPMFDLPRTRGRVYAGYQSFDSSDLGDSLIHFTGDTVLLGGEVIQNVFQHHALFLDVVAGARFEGIHVNNSTSDIGGRGNFLLPYVGLRLERTAQCTSMSGDLTLLGSLSDSSQATRDALGRIDAGQDAMFLQGDYGLSVFLEPLLDPHGFEAGRSTMANELAFSVKGQYAFDQRLIAEEEYVAGGLYTVRGYPESLTAGDSALIGSVEYRFHLPRIFTVKSQPDHLLGQPFRWAPQETYGRPDWDCIFRAFLDAGQVYNTARESFETDSTLIGAGMGAELQFRDNANLRVDVGRALNSVTDAQTGDTLVARGSTHVSVVLTLKY